MTKANKILIGVAAALLIAVVILLVSLSRSNSSSHSDLIKSKNETIQAKEELITEIKAQNHLLDERIALLRDRDSIINAHYSQNQKVYQNLYEQLKNIPDRIVRIANNDDSIRAAFARQRFQ